MCMTVWMKLMFLLFSYVQIFSSRVALIRWVTNVGKMNEFVIVIKKLDSGFALRKPSLYKHLILAQLLIPVFRFKSANGQSNPQPPFITQPILIDQNQPMSSCCLYFIHLLFIQNSILFSKFIKCFPLQKIIYVPTLKFHLFILLEIKFYFINYYHF